MTSLRALIVPFLIVNVTVPFFVPGVDTILAIQKLTFGRVFLGEVGFNSTLWVAWVQSSIFWQYFLMLIF